MVRLIVFSEVFSCPVQSRFYGGDTGTKRDGDFRMTPAFLHESEEGAVLRAKLVERVAEGVEFLGADGPGRFRDIFVLRAERCKNPTQFLAAEMVDAGVARQAEEPRLELRRGLKAVERPDHFDENELGDILDGVAPSHDGIDKPSHAVLISNDELPLSGRLTALRAADKFDRKGRLGWFHAVFIAIPYA
jgi:hypothetical protein